MAKKKYNKLLFILALCSLGLLCGGCQKKDAAEYVQTTEEENTMADENFLSLGPGAGGIGSEEPKEEGKHTAISEPEYTAVKLTQAASGDAVAAAALDDQFLSGTTAFSLNLLKQCMEKPADNGNYMISPASAQMALAIAANGADGQTKRELEQVLWGRMPLEAGQAADTEEKQDIDMLSRYLNTYVEQLTGSEQVHFQNANALWVYDNSHVSSGMENLITVREDYLKKVAAFHAEVYQAPFDDTTVTDINGWVNYNTNGMIPSILEFIPNGAVMYIINAITFEGKWVDQFSPEQMEPDFAFTAADQSVQTVEGMRDNLHGYLEDAHATGFLKYYDGGKYAFAAILPEKGMSPEDYISHLSAEQFIQLFQNADKMQPVRVTMPKFSSEYQVELREALEALGMKEAFLDTADFSLMADTATGVLKIDQVLQKTFIEVDENGTRAAAATALDMDMLTAIREDEPKEVILDRPFIYAVMDMENNLPIFLGVLNSVE
ncbi:MAG: serpin family protein [Lachnospiraceae bacterium]|nr:serpin family protein [Lachnospiraceae bacterium]